jgi:hypothetical protein
LRKLLRKLIGPRPVYLEDVLRQLAEARRPAGPAIPMAQHLASLPPPPPMHEPEWANDTTWHDSREV